MKVLTVSSLPDRRQGGVEILVRQIADELRSAGVESTLVTNGTCAERHSEVHFSVNMACIETRRGLPTFANTIAVCRSFWQVIRVLHSVRPDVVHLHFLDYPLFYFVGLRPLFGYRLIATGHGSEITALTTAPSNSLPHRLLPKLARLCDARTSPSSKIQGEFESVCRSAVVLLKNGIDLEFWRCHKPTRNSREIVCVARLSREKGIDVLLEACSLLRLQQPNFQLMIVGDGPCRAELEDQALSLSLQSHVIFNGWSDANQTREFLSRASVFVLPSRMEGSPLAVIEAMAAGLPIVATSVGGNSELIEHGQCGLLVASEDPAELARAISTLLADPDLRDAFGSAAAAAAAEHSIAAAARASLALYEGLLHTA